MTGLTIQGKQDEIVYNFEISSALDGNDLVFQIPSMQLILNREQWRMDTPSLLSVNLETGKISPELKMHTDTSFFHLFSESKEGIHSFKGELDRVAISSLVREGLISGKPAGFISGSVDYSMIGNIWKWVENSFPLFTVITQVAFPPPSLASSGFPPDVKASAILYSWVL